ncbi:serine/threonine protein kinase [Rubritalea spongiae]|uniref:Serine/threonine protein kinase n=1 Tax=Rubritalea spongiae TaxID=430797 RepID=A0ABW5E4Q9_9BACT
MDEERYEFTRIIGKGRTGGVYEATDHQLERKVAIRRFYSAKGDTSVNGWEETFTNLTHNLSSLLHPNLLGILEAGVDEDGAYLIYPFIEGDTLSKHVDKGPLEETEVYEMAAQLLDALQLAHNNGFIHGAMSTGSITLTPRARGGYTAIINDLGLSRLAPLIQGIESAYARMADPVIMPPEMFEDKEATSQSDLYMLGHLIYLSLIGGHPFAEIDLAELSRAHRDGTLPPITDYRSDLCPKFIEWIAKLTESNVKKRFSGASEALHRLPTLTPKEQRNSSRTAPPQLVVPKLPNKIIHTATVETLPVYIPTKKSGTKLMIAIGSFAAILLIGLVALMGSGNNSSKPVTLADNQQTAGNSTPATTLDKDKLVPVNNTPSSGVEETSLPPILSERKIVRYSNPLNAPIGKPLLNITNTQCDDWIVYQGKSLTKETSSHPKGDIIQTTSNIGSFVHLKKPIGLVRFHQIGVKRDKVPALHANTKHCDLDPGEGWKVKLVAPDTLANQKIQVQTHFTTWNCDGIITYKDNNGKIIGKPKRYGSERTNTSFGTSDILSNLEPNEEFFIEITASEPKSGDNLGLSLNGLKIKILDL